MRKEDRNLSIGGGSFQTRTQKPGRKGPSSNRISETGGFEKALSEHEGALYMIEDGRIRKLDLLK